MSQCSASRQFLTDFRVIVVDMRRRSLLWACGIVLLFMFASPERAVAQHAGFPTAVDASHAGFRRAKMHKSHKRHAFSRDGRGSSSSQKERIVDFAGIGLQGGWGMNLGNKDMSICSLLEFDADVGVLLYEVLGLSVGIGIEAFESGELGGLTFSARISYSEEESQFFAEYKSSSFSAFSLGFYFRNLGGKISYFDFGQPVPYSTSRGCLGFSLLLRWCLFD